MRHKTLLCLPRALLGPSWTTSFLLKRPSLGHLRQIHSGSRVETSQEVKTCGGGLSETFQFKYGGGKIESLAESFLDGQVALQHKTFKELLRSYIVLRLCCVDLFADNAFKIFNSFRWILGDRLFSFLFKPTVYRLFIAGETEAEIMETASRLSKAGIKPLLSPMLEDDPDQSATKSDLAKVHQQNMSTILDCIQICQRITNSEPKVLAIKLTAFMRPSLLQEIVVASGNKIGTKIEEDLFDQFSKAFHYDDETYLQTLNFKQAHIEELATAFKKLRLISEKCLANRVSVFIDAEHSTLQPAVRLITLVLMDTYNKSDKAIMWNTYQCYLKDTEAIVISDNELAAKRGFCWGGKVVRGAYLDYERDMALRMGVACPVHDSFEDTSKAYERTSQYLIQRKLEKCQPCEFILATHNRHAVLKACQTIEEITSSPAQVKGVHFGQIAGMAEGVSLGLAVAGYSIYKLVPCGTVSEVLPWLARRMSENRSLAVGANADRLMIYQEIVRRSKEIVKLK